MVLYMRRERRHGVLAGGVGSISDDVCRCATLRSIFLLRSVGEARQIDGGKGSNRISKEQKDLNHA